LIGEEDVHAVAVAIACFSRRAAKLAGTAISALVRLRFPSGPEQIVTVAVDGSVYRSYGNGRCAEIIKSTLREILGPQESAKIKLVAVRNAGCIGAALAAMLYSTK
jgi:hexokinase